MRNLEDWPLAIKPMYRTTAVNQTIRLYSGTLEAEQLSEKVLGAGTISLEWLPTPRIQFVLKGLPYSNRLELGNIALRMPDKKQAINSMITRHQLTTMEGRLSIRRWER